MATIPVNTAARERDEPERQSWLSRRTAWRALAYPIPANANRWQYMLGGLSLALFAVLVGTGIVLDQFYDPTPLSAHDSVVYIATRLPFGHWVRSLHYWSASFFLVSVAAHTIAVFVRRAYRPPREVTWWLGVVLLILAAALAFTGTVLRADQEGVEALAHAVAGAELLGPLGAVLSSDFAPSTSLLARIHGAHVSILPLGVVSLLAFHLWLVRHLGIAAEGSHTVPFTTHLRRLAGAALLLLGALSVLAALRVPALGDAGQEGIEITKPFWPFLWIYALENTVGLWGMVLGPTVVVSFLFLIPFFDRGVVPEHARPAWLSWLAAALLLALVAGILYGAVAPQQQHLM